MKMRKKIDELYRERLRHVETPPPPDSWQNISDRLPQKKEKRILPIWYKMAGTAAAIALLFLIFSRDSSTSDPILTNTSTPIEYLNFDPTTPAFREYMNTSTAILESAVLETRFEILKQELQNFGMQRARELREDQTSTLTGEGSLAESSAEVGKEDQKITEQTFLAQLEHTIKIHEKPSAENEEIAEGPGKDIDETQKPFGNEALALEPEALQKLQEETFKEEVAQRTNSARRFSITPTAAAVYLDNFGSGNLLDDSFANRESGGEISMAYGVNLAYRVSEKLKLRSGISKVNLAYNTRAVNFASVLSSQAITIDSPESITIPDGLGSNNTIFTSASALNQNMGFIEVPLEIEYVILDKKAGINLIGGLSTLFLESNAVALSSDRYRTHLGEANNINDLSFSANVGVGVHYKITPLIQFNLEPILKYQINTFNKTSNLHSYFFGVYSGFSFKF